MKSFCAHILLWTMLILDGQMAIAGNEPFCSMTNLQKMGLEINSDAEEIFPLQSPDGQTLYFARYLHDGNSGGMSGGHDIWVSKKENGQWTSAQNFAFLNTHLSDAVIGIGPLGEIIYLLNDQTSTQPGIGQINVTAINGSNAPSHLPLQLPSTANDIYGAFVSPDGNLAFVSVKHDSLNNGFDILLYKKLRTGWRRINLAGINTSSSEFSPFLAHDNTLYFASNRPGGFGGYDIYYSKPENESLTRWSKPVNLGSDVNSNAYDAYFSTYPGGTSYFVSNRDSKLSDIYTCTITWIAPEAENTEEAITLKEVPRPEKTETEKMQDELAKKGQAAPKFVYFESNSSALTDSAILTLDKLIDVIQQDPSVKIELRGYSDNLGSADYNLKLSALRSESVKAYLISKGVKAKKITTIGAGTASPLASNETEEGRARNRRVRLILHKHKK